VSGVQEACEVTRYLGRHGESRVTKAALDQRGAAANGEDGGQSARDMCNSLRQSAHFNYGLQV
jgi:hypothetical protein